MERNVRDSFESPYQALADRLREEENRVERDGDEFEWEDGEDG